MQDYQEAMVKSLVAVAWADGRVDDEESEVIEALLAAFEIAGADAEAIREYVVALSPAEICVQVGPEVACVFVDGCRPPHPSVHHSAFTTEPSPRPSF